MISVIITTYGEDHWRELAWERALPSADSQGADEVILHHAPDLPIGPARNEAAARAKPGSWLVFLDADDELEPGYIDAMRVASENQHAYRLFRPSVRYVRKGRVPDPLMPPAGDLRTDNFIVIGAMIAQPVFAEVGGFSDYPHGFEDWSLWAKAWKAGCSIIPVPEATYRAFINPMSKHRQGWRNRKWQVDTHLRIQAELFPEGVN